LLSRIAAWLFSDTGSLRTRVFRGGLWLFVANMLNRVAGLVKVALLARILAPTDFGLMGIAMLTLRWLEYFSQTGFNVALIQKQSDPRPYFPTAWTVQVLRGAGLSLLLLIGAPLVSSFFDNPEAESVVRAVSLVVLFRGFTSPAVISLRRDLDFRRETFWRLTGTLSGLVVALILGVIYRNVWALMISIIVAQAVETAVSYYVLPYRPRFELNRAHYRELTHTGKWVFWSNLITFLAGYVDRVVIGKVLGTATLGLYEMAVQLALYPSSQIGMYLRGLMLPAVGKLERVEDLRRVFLRSFHLVCLVVFPLASFLTAFATPVIHLTIGDRWMSTAPLIQVLGWTGAFVTLAELTWPIIFKCGGGRLIAVSLIWKLLVLGGTMFPLLQAGAAVGVAWAALLGSVAAFGYLLFHTARLLGITLAECGRAAIAGLLGSLPFLSTMLVVSDPWSIAGLAAGGLALLLYGLLLGRSLRSYVFRSH
jgi:lipopolysaccharide exporter